MKRYYILIFAAIILIYQASSQSLQTKPPTLWSTFISVGYANATSNDVSDYYNRIVDSYRLGGIPIPTQTKFSRTVIVNAGGLFTRLESIWFGFSIGYIYSPAYSNYKDYIGSLKVNGSVSSFEISILVKATLAKIGNFPIYLCGQPGINKTTSSITQELKFSDFPQNNFNSKWSVSAWGPCFQGTLGSSVQLGEFTISLEAGYRFSRNKVSTETIASSIEDYRTPISWDIGLSGFISLVSLGKKL